MPAEVTHDSRSRTLTQRDAINATEIFYAIGAQKLNVNPELTDHAELSVSQM